MIGVSGSRRTKSQLGGKSLPRFHRVVDVLFNELKVIGICQGVIRTFKKRCVRGEITGSQNLKISINVEVGLMKER